MLIESFVRSQGVITNLFHLIAASDLLVVAAAGGCLAQRARPVQHVVLLMLLLKAGREYFTHFFLY